MKKSILAILVAVLMASALLLTSCSQPVAMATLADLMDTSYVAEYDKMATELVKLNGMKKYDETTYQGSSTDGELLYFVGTETEYDEWGAELEITIIQVIYNVETDTVVWNNEVTYPIISEDKTTFTSVNFPSVGDADVFEIKTYEAYAPISDGSYAEIESTVLYDADGTVIVEKDGDAATGRTWTATNDDEGKIVFPTITYDISQLVTTEATADAAGTFLASRTFTYEVSEDDTQNAGVTKSDATLTATVTIKDKKDGTLEVTASDTAG
jgi:hypothetical protein